VAVLTGFEPAASTLTGWRSLQTDLQDPSSGEPDEDPRAVKNHRVESQKVRQVASDHNPVPVRRRIAGRPRCSYVAPVMPPSNPAPLSAWSLRAVNLPEHADNPVHTDAGGRAAGYDAAVVAGTTVYAYLTRPAAAAWGVDWIDGGSAEVRFTAAVLADEALDIVPVESVDGWVIEARGAGGVAARCSVTPDGPPPPDPEGERLEPLVVALDERWVGYAARAGEDLSLYAERGIVHPVVWPSLANRVFATQLVDGPWVHTRSAIRHLGAAAPGETALVESWLKRRFDTRRGERALVDVRISIDGRPIAAIDHEALVRLV
jgi:hypothetical protein